MLDRGVPVCVETSPSDRVPWPVTRPAYRRKFRDVFSLRVVKWCLDAILHPRWEQNNMYADSCILDPHKTDYVEATLGKLAQHVEYISCSGNVVFSLCLPQCLLSPAGCFIEYQSLQKRASHLYLHMLFTENSWEPVKEESKQYNTIFLWNVMYW